MSEVVFDKKHVNYNAQCLWSNKKELDAINYIANEYNINRIEAKIWCDDNLEYPEILTICMKCNSMFQTVKGKETPVEADMISVNWCPKCDCSDIDEDYLETYYKEIQ